MPDDDVVRFEDDAPDALVVHRRSWSQADLLEHVARRHLSLGVRLNDRPPAWEIKDTPDATTSSALLRLNEDLEPLGWMVRLHDDRPAVLHAIPRPRGQFTGRRWRIALWAMSALTLTLASLVGTASSRPAEGIISTSAFLDAVVLTTVPALALLAFASLVQVRLASRFGVRVGPIVPVPDPSILLWALGLVPVTWLVWPYGILVIPTLPRMDARPWPDRRSLGWTSLSAPIVLIIGGLTFWMVGLLLTPATSSVSGATVSHDAGWLLMLLDGLLRTDLAIRAAWAHPLVWAGATMAFLAWVSLLHVPTFPGGRLHVARLGATEVRTTQTQVLLLVAFAFGAVLFDVFSTFSVWSLVLPVVLMLTLLMGSDQRWPVVLDETRPVEERQHRWMGLIWVMLLLLALPSETPLVAHDDWDAALEGSTDGNGLALLHNGSWNLSLTVVVDNPSLLDRTVVLTASMPPGWEGWWASCSGSPTCEVDLAAGRSTAMHLEASWEGEGAPSSGSFEVVGLPMAITVPLDVDLDAVPVNGTWTLERDTLGTMLCTQVRLRDAAPSANLSFITPPYASSLLWWSGVGSISTVVEASGDACLRASDPMLLLHLPPSGIVLNGSMFLLEPPTVPSRLTMDENGWTISDAGWGAGLDAGGTLHFDGEACPEPDAPTSTPPQGEDGWVWDLAVRDAGALPVIAAGENLTLRTPTEGHLLHCPMDGSPPVVHQLERGPDLVVFTPHVERAWIGYGVVLVDGFVLHGPSLASNGTFLLSLQVEEDVPFVVDVVGDGAGWSIDELPSLLAGHHEFWLTPPAGGTSSVVLDHIDGRVVLRMSSMEV